MTIEIPAYKYVQDNQTLDLSTNKICTLIGENGSGKSTLLESIFSNYIDKENELRENDEIQNINQSLRCIVFSSGQNELFSEIFNNYDKNARRYNREDEQTIRSFYFDYWWSRLLIFFATSLKKDGLVRTYLREKNYIDELNEKDNSSYISFGFRVRKPLTDRIINEHNREEKGEYIDNSLIRSLYIRYLEKIIKKTIDSEYSFREKETIKRIVSQGIKLKANEVKDVLGVEVDEIFTFIARASSSWLSNFNLEDIGFYFKNDLELAQLSDGEYQLLSIYAIIDLFDNDNTMFLFDEIDSHLHFSNISKLWNILKTISGKVITTTHISESILNNDFNSISYIEKGKIVNDLVPKKVLEKISNVVNQEKFIYQICSKLENIVLIDDESDWEIFKELAKIKIGEDAVTLLKDIVAIKETSSYNSDFQLFGNEKMEFTKNIKAYSVANTINLKNIFMICDLDEYQITNINQNHQCVTTQKLKPYIDEIQKFNHNQTKAYLLSWKRREILHYMISYSMLKEYNKLEELKNIANYIVSDEYINNNFDNDNNIKITSKANVKFIKKLMSKENGDVDADNWTDYDKLKQIIGKIPANEISEDIVKMYEFIKSKVESN